MCRMRLFGFRSLLFLGGQVGGGSYGTDNAYVKAWSYNCPAVRIRATPVGEVDIVRLSAIGVGDCWCYLYSERGLVRGKKGKYVFQCLSAV